MIQLLQDLLDGLSQAGIDSMVVGSVASSLHGLYRTTYDVDIVIQTDRARLDRFLASLPPDRYYFSAETARAELQRRGQFNVVELSGGSKVVLTFLKARPFSRSEFARRREQPALGRTLLVASPEDVILGKLEWNRITPSERQLRDVAGILQMRPGGLDLEYLRRWGDELTVREQLEDLLRQSTAS